MARNPIPPNLESRIEYDTNGGCWLWTKCSDQHGYGQISVGGKRYRAHRLSYTMHIGPIPQGLDLCHRCDTPACINPAHLFPGTARDNAIDMARKGRAPMTRHPSQSYFGRADCTLKGEAHSRAKLSDEQIKDILSAHAQGMKRAKIATAFDISISYLDKVTARRAPRVTAMIDAIRLDRSSTPTPKDGETVTFVSPDGSVEHVVIRHPGASRGE